MATHIPPELDAAAVSVYVQVLANGELDPARVAEQTGLSVSEVDRCVTDLLGHCLLAPVPGSALTLAPVSPDLAAARLVQPIEDAIQQYRSSADSVRERLLQFMPAYLARRGIGTSDSDRGLQVVPEAGDVQLLIREAVDGCTKELMTVQPGGRRDPDALADALPRDLAAISRGVRMRVLYQHTTRTVLGARAYVSAIVEAGAQVRTADQLAERMLIFDREVVFIPKWTIHGQPPGAVVVREPVLVSFLCALFDQFWSNAVPFIPAGPGYQDVSDDLQRSVVRLLAQGLKDEVIARRLGMSVRTCRRHIATLMQELGAESRFEAGVRAAQLGLLDKGTIG